MAEATCRVCGKAVNAAAIECPHCGAAQPGAADVAEPDAGERVKKTAKGIGCVALSMVALVLAIIVAVLAFLF